MKQSPSSEADIRSARQEVLRLLRKPKAYYSIQESPPLNLLLSQLNPVSYPISKLSFNNLILRMRVTYPAHLIFLDLITVRYLVNKLSTNYGTSHYVVFLQPINLSGPYILITVSSDIIKVCSSHVLLT
jgi:hypothetical protein